MTAPIPQRCTGQNRRLRAIIFKRGNLTPDERAYLAKVEAMSADEYLAHVGRK